MAVCTSWFRTSTISNLRTNISARSMRLSRSATPRTWTLGWRAAGDHSSLEGDCLFVRRDRLVLVVERSTPEMSGLTRQPRKQPDIARAPEGISDDWEQPCR